MSMCFQLIAIAPTDIEKLSHGDAIDKLLCEHIQAPSDHALDIDKSWDAVDFLFHQSDKSLLPRNWLTESGEPIGEDLGYGPARVWSNEILSEITEKTALCDVASIKADFDFALLSQAKVYPNFWDQ